MVIIWELSDPVLLALMHLLPAEGAVKIESSY